MAKKNEGGRIRARALDAVRAGKEKVLDARDRTEDFLKERPFTSVAIAAGIGAIVALGVSALIKPARKSFIDRLRDLY